MQHLFRQRGVPAPLQLDFVPQTRAASLAGWLMLLAGLLSLPLLLLEHRALVERRDTLAAQVEDLARSMGRREAEASSTRRSTASREGSAALAQAADVARALDAPWAGWLSQIETVSHADIGLLSLELDAARGSLLIEGDARSLEAVFAYAERLGAQGLLSEVQVQNYQFVVRGTQRVVSFRIAARTGAPA